MRPAAEEAALDTLSPREIQSRLRSGATVAELVEETGMDAAAIERFSGPPLAERAWVSEQARACVVRPGTDELQTLVQRESSDGADLSWDAWRRADGRWTVVAATGDGEARVSTWVYDPRSRSVHPDDAASHRLASEDVVVPLRASSSTVTIPRDTPAARDDGDADALASDDEASDVVVVDIDAQRGSADAEGADSDSGDGKDVQAPSGRGKSRKSRRASVPRWDEILFGAGQDDA